MAKFATALCILFVAYGAQGFNVFNAAKSFASSVASGVESGLEKVKTASETAEKDVETAIDSAADSTASLNSTVQAWITAFEEKYEKLAAEAKAIRACITSNINVTKIEEEIAANTSSCASEALTKLETQYETTLAELEKVTTDQATITLAFEACAANFTSLAAVAACDAKVYLSVSANYTTDVSDLVADATTLYTDYYSFSSTLAACGSSSAVEVIKSEWETDSTIIEACIKNATSTSS